MANDFIQLGDMNYDDIRNNIKTYMSSRSDLDFDFDGSEMASFYKTDNNWVEGEEIPLFNMSEAGESLYMKNCYINTTIPAVGDKLIYVYDFLKMWTFYVEVIETNSETNENLPKIILSVGEVPLQAPEKEFIAEKSDNSFEDEFNDEFESLDDIDFDRY